MPRIYVAEQSFVAQLMLDRAELFAVARSMGSAEAMRSARKELVESVAAYTLEKHLKDPTKSYFIDDAGTAHIPIVGELTPLAETDACGAYTAGALTEYGFIRAAARAADNDARVKKIQFDVNSPGGYVDGVDETYMAIASLKKPTASFITSKAASGAYWLIAATDERIAASPVVQVGSIGVVVEEYDQDPALEAAGIIHRTYTSTDAPDKRPDTKTTEGQMKIIEQLDDLHRVFVGRISEGLGVSAEHINEKFGRGGMVIASRALEVGMIDRIEGQDMKRKKSPGVAGSGFAAQSQKKEVRIMDLKEFQATYPGVYQEAVAVGRQEGISAEQKRVTDLRAFLGINPMGDNAVNDAMASGKSYTEAAASIHAAIEKGKVTNAGGENPPEASTKAADTGSGAVALDAEELKIIEGMGISKEAYLAMKKKEGK